MFIILIIIQKWNLHTLAPKPINYDQLSLKSSLSQNNELQVVLNNFHPERETENWQYLGQQQKNYYYDPNNNSFIKETSLSPLLSESLALLIKHLITDPQTSSQQLFKIYNTTLSQHIENYIHIILKEKNNQILSQETLTSIGHIILQKKVFPQVTLWIQKQDPSKQQQYEERLSIIKTISPPLPKVHLPDLLPPCLFGSLESTLFFIFLGEYLDLTKHELSLTKENEHTFIHQVTALIMYYKSINNTEKQEELILLLKEKNFVLIAEMILESFKMSLNVLPSFSSIHQSINELQKNSEDPLLSSSLISFIKDILINKEDSSIESSIIQQHIENHFKLFPTKENFRLSYEQLISIGETILQKKVYPHIQEWINQQNSSQQKSFQEKFNKLQESDPPQLEINFPKKIFIHPNEDSSSTLLLLFLGEYWDLEQQELISFEEKKINSKDQYKALLTYYQYTNNEKKQHKLTEFLKKNPLLFQHFAKILTQQQKTFLFSLSNIHFMLPKGNYYSLKTKSHSKSQPETPYVTPQSSLASHFDSNNSSLASYKSTTDKIEEDDNEYDNDKYEFDNEYDDDKYESDNEYDDDKYEFDNEYDDDKDNYELKKEDQYPPQIFFSQHTEFNNKDYQFLTLRKDFIIHMNLNEKILFLKSYITELLKVLKFIHTNNYIHNDLMGRNLLYEIDPFKCPFQISKIKLVDLDNAQTPLKDNEDFYLDLISIAEIFMLLFEDRIYIDLNSSKLKGSPRQAWLDFFCSTININENINNDKQLESFFKKFKNIIFKRSFTLEDIEKLNDQITNNPEQTPNYPVSFHHKWNTFEEDQWDELVYKNLERCLGKINFTLFTDQILDNKSNFKYQDVWKNDLSFLDKKRYEIKIDPLQSIFNLEQSFIEKPPLSPLIPICSTDARSYTSGKLEPKSDYSNLSIIVQTIEEMSQNNLLYTDNIQNNDEKSLTILNAHRTIFHHQAYLYNTFLIAEWILIKASNWTIKKDLSLKDYYEEVLERLQELIEFKSLDNELTNCASLIVELLQQTNTSKQEYMKKLENIKQVTLKMASAKKTKKQNFKTQLKEDFKTLKRETKTLTNTLKIEINNKEDEMKDTLKRETLKLRETLKTGIDNTDYLVRNTLKKQENFESTLLRKAQKKVKKKSLYSSA